MSFCKDFAWGVATASYQIEGGAHEHDKGLNVWDVASVTEGRIFEGHSGDIGCDHYHRFKEDIALMKSLNIKHYRLSINWARLMPHGMGKLNDGGVRFYTELLEEMKGAGITPWLTLFHWDYPYELYLRGGWLNAESSEWFKEYAAACASLFGKYTNKFILINEPECFVGLGHSTGGHAPFLKLSDSEVLRVAHNVLLACGKAEKVIRATVGNAEIGISNAYWPALPYTEKDTEVARSETFACHENFGTPNLWLDPLVFGKYPEEYATWFKKLGFEPAQDDLKIIKSKLDFCGLNTYSGGPVTLKEGKPFYPAPAPTVPKTDMRWNVFPEAMYYGPKMIFERYGLPVIYTENGIALTEWKTLEGEINDDMRIDFIKRYLRSLHRAAQEIPIKGYFYWSFIDDFEWAEGFSKKFGLVHIDYATGERTPKKSAYYYKQVCETNGEVIFK